MNAAAQGTVYPDVSFTVDPARVATFREVFGIRHGVPPTFVTAAEFSVLPTIMADPALNVDVSRIVHGTQEYLFERPLREGETLVARARIASIKHKGGTGFLTIETELRDADGVVCIARAQLIERER